MAVATVEADERGQYQHGQYRNDCDVRPPKPAGVVDGTPRRDWQLADVIATSRGEILRLIGLNRRRRSGRQSAPDLRVHRRRNERQSWAFCNDMMRRVKISTLGSSNLAAIRRQFERGTSARLHHDYCEAIYFEQRCLNASVQK